ncbi:MAG TPA: hypothetical protein VMV49_08560 [Candidatus Deferrimicrobium sp.]|nr:hypothetical protein [Candidatus Deferrimicrobium sp.]
MAFSDLTPYQQISVYLFSILIVCLGVLILYMALKAKKAEQERKYYFISIAIFAILYMVCRILLLIDYINPLPPLSPLYIWGSFFAVLGVAGLMFAVEKYVYQKLKFFPSICILIFSTLILLFPGDATTRFVTIWVSIGTAFAIIIPILYLKVGFNSSGEIRKNSLEIAFGILLFFIGNAMNTGFLTNIYEIFFILAPITMIIGLVLFQFGFK